MDLFGNPFYVLGITFRDNRSKIIEKAEEKSLTNEPDKCVWAKNELLNPRKRITSELAWLPGLGPRRINEVINMLIEQPDQVIEIKNVSGLVKCNLLASGLKQQLGKLKSEDLIKWIIDLANNYEAVDSENVMALLNEVRVVSGFPSITDLGIIESEILDRRNYFRAIIKESLNLLKTNDLIDTVTKLIQSVTSDGKKHAPLIIDDLIDSYQLECQTFLDEEGKNIKKLIGEANKEYENSKNEELLNLYIDKIEEVVENWQFVTLPIQISLRSRGHDHSESDKIANLIRNFSISLFNDHGKLELAKRLTVLTQNKFSHVTRISEQALKDSHDLKKIENDRENQDRENEKWRREISYVGDVGTIFAKIVKITPEGIEYRNKLWPFSSITAMRWGATRRSVNGIPTGTTYKIVFGNGKLAAIIETRKSAEYREITKRLWMTVGIRLLSEFVSGLKNGKTYRFGDTELNDQGINLWRKKMLRPAERVFYRWPDVQFWDRNGALCIADRMDHNTGVSLSYQDLSNVHILSSALNLYQMRGGELLSIIL